MAFEIREGWKPMNVNPMDFRVKQSQVDVNNARVSAYRKASKKDEQAALLDEQRKKTFTDVIRDNPDLDELGRLRAVSVAYMAQGDYEGYNMVKKLERDQVKFNTEAKAKQAQQQKRWAEISDIGATQLALTPTMDNAKLILNQWEQMGNPASKILKQAIDENPDATPEQIKQFALFYVSPERKKQHFEDLGGTKEQTNLLSPGMTLDKSVTPKDQYAIDNPTAAAPSKYPAWEKVRTPQGIFYHNKFTNETVAAVSPEGEHLQHALDDPDTRGEVKQAQSEGKEVGEATGKAKINLPVVEEQSKFMLRHIDEMIGSKDGKIKPHAGFQDFVGATWKPGARFIEGSDAASFQARHEQVKGEAFKEAFQSLKGGGQISNVEGEAATKALNRMDKAQSEKEYKAAARDFQKEIRVLVKLAKKRAKASKVNNFVKGKNKVIEVDW
jgi:hypothetical protein